MQLKDTDKLILSCIKINSTAKELEEIDGFIPEILNWDYLISTIIDRGIGPLFYKRLPFLTNNSLIPETLRTKLQQAWYKTFSRSTILYEHFRKIADAFTINNIQVIALKGIYLSEWMYKDIGLRQFSDIDLLIKEEDAIRCICILSELGYFPSEVGLSKLVESQFEIVHYPPMILNGVSVELHIRLHKKTEDYHINLSSVWNNAIPAIINGVQVYTLNINDLLIHLCVHLDKHFKGGKVQFTCFNDITNLLEKCKDTLDWNELIKDSILYNCEDVIFKYIVMVHKFINATVPANIIQKYTILLTETDEQMFCNYLMGNFGIPPKLSKHFGYINKVEGLSEKASYLRDILFPSKIFMIQKYQIKQPTFVLFFYPYRYYIGLMGVLNHLFRTR